MYGYPGLRKYKSVINQKALICVVSLAKKCLMDVTFFSDFFN